MIDPNDPVMINYCNNARNEGTYPEDMSNEDISQILLKNGKRNFKDNKKR